MALLCKVDKWEPSVGCPTHLAKNGAETGQNSIFLDFWVGTAGIRMRRNFFGWIVAQTENSNVGGLFWKFSRRAEYCGPLSRRSGSDPLKVGILGCLPLQKRPPIFLRCFFGCRIQCRSWFCHQTWFSLMASISYGRLKVRGQNGQKGMNIP